MSCDSLGALVRGGARYDSDAADCNGAFNAEYVRDGHSQMVLGTHDHNPPLGPRSHWGHSPTTKERSAL